MDWEEYTDYLCGSEMLRHFRTQRDAAISFIVLFYDNLSPPEDLRPLRSPALPGGIPELFFKTIRIFSNFMRHIQNKAGLKTGQI